jgi:hypothetical protein
MLSTLDALAAALMPVPGCLACRPALGGACPECTRARADFRAVNAAMAAVEVAGTEAQARAVYQACVLGLANAIPARLPSLPVQQPQLAGPGDRLVA